MDIKLGKECKKANIEIGEVFAETYKTSFCDFIFISVKMAEYEYLILSADYNTAFIGRIFANVAFHIHKLSKTDQAKWRTD